MNNTISVEIARTVVSETNVKNTDGSEGAAKSEVKSGKKLPLSEDTVSPQQSKKTIEVTVQNTQSLI